jgi:hypothetical protein
MTQEEFRSQYEAYSWDPYHPLGVILANGQRVYIDKPEQVELTLNELVLTRRSTPSKPERYHYSEISQLVPLLELPADPGGISYAEFDPLIRELLMAEPFQPFAIKLKTGEVIEIGRRPEIGRAGRYLNIRKEYAVTHLTYDQLARLIPQSRSIPA